MLYHILARFEFQFIYLLHLIISVAWKAWTYKFKDESTAEIPRDGFFFPFCMISRKTFQEFCIQKTKMSRSINDSFAGGSQRVRSFGRIWIRVSHLWRSFRANPFSDQGSIKPTLDKDSSDHWSARSKEGSLDHWSNAFLWAKDPKLIILPNGTQFQTSRYFIYWPKDCLLHKFCDDHEIKSILYSQTDPLLIAGIQGSQVSVSIW